MCIICVYCQAVTGIYGSLMLLQWFINDFESGPKYIIHGTLFRS